MIEEDRGEGDKGAQQRSANQKRDGVKALPGEQGGARLSRNHAHSVNLRAKRLIQDAFTLHRALLQHLVVRKRLTVPECVERAPALSGIKQTCEEHGRFVVQAEKGLGIHGKGDAVHLCDQAFGVWRDSQLCARV